MLTPLTAVLALKNRIHVLHLTAQGVKLLQNKFSILLHSNRNMRGGRWQLASPFFFALEVVSGDLNLKEVELTAETTPLLEIRFSYGSSSGRCFIICQLNRKRFDTTGS